jgi:hypothetical protein
LVTVQAAEGAHEVVAEGAHEVEAEGAHEEVVERKGEMGVVAVATLRDWAALLPEVAA